MPCNWAIRWMADGQGRLLRLQGQPRQAQQRPPKGQSGSECLWGVGVVDSFWALVDFFNAAKQNLHWRELAGWSSRQLAHVAMAVHSTRTSVLVVTLSTTHALSRVVAEDTTVPMQLTVVTLLVTGEGLKGG